MRLEGGGTSQFLHNNKDREHVVSDQRVMTFAAGIGGCFCKIVIVLCLCQKVDSVLL